ncbi:hypothetical protein [Acuticoccus sediminis]|uniref:hypothetical protein n=1 Tax=Acuticoccus sediminis TaxID=2184697 RepID=UPI0011B9346E|nr:hypothetical protein [Acuticoccus sediminis]
MHKGRGTGGIEPAEIEEFIRSANLPQDTGSSADARFCFGVAKLVATRVVHGESGDFSVFVSTDAIRIDEERLACDRVMMLQHGNDPITGHIWITTIGITTSLRLRIDITSEESITAGLEDAGLGNRPAVVVDWRGSSPSGRLYSTGVSNHDISHPVNFDCSTPVSEGQLKRTLDLFYETVLRTPSATTMGHKLAIWGANSGDARKGIPSSRPEERIQGRLLDSLRLSIPGLTWRAEPVTEDGRADLVGSRPTSAGGIRATVTEWILELKALADKTSTGNPVSATKIAEAIIKGVEQAIAYRDNHHALQAAVCYFDMRATDEGDAVSFADIRDLASGENISLWRWYMFRSTDAARHAKIGKLTHSQV